MMNAIQRIKMDVEHGEAFGLEIVTTSVDDLRTVVGRLESLEIALMEISELVGSSELADAGMMAKEALNESS
jgi:hypothetical protein